jgi:sugar lactone lactonase YvrE
MLKLALRFHLVEIQSNILFCLVPPRSTVLSGKAKWIQNGVIVAGGNENGSELYQLWAPSSICIDDEQNVFVVDQANNRIVEWEPSATEGQIVGGSNRGGSAENQLSSPNDLVIDKQTDSFIISDSGNQRVVRWARRSGAVGETVISNIHCKCLTIDETGSIYVTDNEKHAVRRYNIGDTEGTIVAGGNGAGDRLDQLDNPSSIFVDQNYSVYVSDENNHRVIKWKDGAIQGIVVAGGKGQGNSLSQLNFPQGVIVDQLGTVYVADYFNDRVMRWFKGATKGEVIVGGNYSGKETNQISHPNGLAFDTKGNLYVVEWDNARVQRFNIISNSR